jgi:hypothetical protein
MGLAVLNSANISCNSLNVETCVVMQDIPLLRSLIISLSPVDCVRGKENGGKADPSFPLSVRGRGGGGVATA